MKLNSIIASVAAAILAVACTTPQKIEGSKEVRDLLPSASQVDSASYLLGTNIGQWIKGNDFGDLNFNQFLKGIKDMIKAEGDQRDSTFSKQFRIAPEMIDEVMQNFMGKRSEYTKALNKEKGDAYLEANKAKDSIEVAESGLQYKILAPGNDKKAVSDEDTVWVNYKGYLINGKIFDESREGNPAQFTPGRVVKGFGEGVKLLGEGGKAILYIPAELGYGEQDNRRYGSPIGPNETLVFEIEVTKVGTFVPKEEEPAKDTKKKK